MSLTLKTIEIEYKHLADNINLEDFIGVAEKEGYVKKLMVSSWDYYYTPNEKNSLQFIRFREGAVPELTIKKKLNFRNNNSRVEVDLPLQNKHKNNKDLKSYVDKFIKLLGFSFSFKIKKTCTIYFKKDVNYVYYKTFDSNNKYLNSFIEIEANKDYIFNNKKEVWDAVNKAELLFKNLGISKKTRLKKSQFELNSK